jgi:hypothetical protein
MRTALRLVLTLIVFGLGSLGSPVAAQIATEPLYDFQAANVYAELFPETRQAHIVAQVYLYCNGSDPVKLRCDGNLYSLRITGAEGNNVFHLVRPYIHLYRLPAGSHVLTLEYLVQHWGDEPSGAIISPAQLNLPAAAFWYPRQDAIDPHQALLNIVTPEGYQVEANASKTRDVPNNFKRLRTFYIRNELVGGMELTGGR